MKISTIMTSLILLSGILGFGFSAYAQEAPPPPELPPEAVEAAASEGCDESDDRASAAARNPHCDQAPAPDPLPASPCDTEPDGDIDAAELQAWINPQIDPDITLVEAQNIIDLADGDASGVVDNADEYVALNDLLALNPDIINLC